MKQIALFLATSVAILALPAFAQRAQGPAFHAPVPHRPIMPGARPQVGHHPPGFGRRHHHHHRGWNNAGWPVFMAPPGVAPTPPSDVVTHEFIDPRLYGPRPPSVEILTDKPVVFREPPHIIQIRRAKQRHPILVVRRGVVSRE
jgi:hypothetical protein